METIIDRYEARGKAEGDAGRLLLQIHRKIEKNKPFEQIVDECESTEEEIRPFYEKAMKELGRV